MHLEYERWCRTNKKGATPHREKVPRAHYLPYSARKTDTQALCKPHSECCVSIGCDAH